MLRDKPSRCSVTRHDAPFRPRYLGESALPLNERYARATVFIMAERATDRGLERVPVGTGFLVSVPIDDEELRQDYHFLYLVTAAHVVRTLPHSWARFNLRAGGVRDLEVPAWIHHAEGEDVAVCFVGAIDIEVFEVYYASTDDFVDVDVPLPKLGDTVYFIGLVAQITAMHEANVPMVRSGTLGRLYQEQIRVTFHHGVVARVTAHLIDCRSYSGFSGSPCFIQYHVVRKNNGGTSSSIETRLLGIVMAHFDDVAPDRISRHTGIGLVLPVERIRELLMDERLQRVRAEAIEDRRKRREEEEPAAAADTAAEDSKDDERRVTLAPLSPEAALRALLQTPRRGQD